MDDAAATPRQVWLDTDPGFDDWMAWALLEADPAVRLHGVSVVAGNAPLAATLDNALRIKALHGFATPVHAGCDRPLVQPAVTAEDVLGAGAMASHGRRLPAARAAPSPGHGVAALVDCVRAHPGQVTLLAVGPLSNVAAALALAPELPSLLRSLVIMGGSAHGGNTTPVAEFNVYADPEAAQRVFECGVPVQMFGLDGCRHVPVDEAHLALLRRLPGERAAIFCDHLDAYIEHGRREGATGMALYDPAPVIWLARPDLFELRPARVDVELAGRHTRGMTVCDFRVPPARANARVAVAADGAAALDWVMATLPRALSV